MQASLTQDEKAAISECDPRSPEVIPQYFRSLQNVKDFINRQPELLTRQNKYSADKYARFNQADDVVG